MALPVSWWLESHLDIWNPSPFQWLSCDWPELFKDCIPSFPGSAEPSNSHCTENIPDSRENRTEGSHRHNLKEETMTHQAQRRSALQETCHPHLLATCLCLLWLWRKKTTKYNLLVEGGKRKKICFVWVLVSSSQCDGVFNCVLKLSFVLVMLSHKETTPFEKK